MPEEWWVRVQENAGAANPIEINASARILVPFQPWHVRRQGVRSQADLSGSGVLDFKLEIPPVDRSNWSFQEAVSYCAGELGSFVRSRAPDVIAARSDAFTIWIEFTETATYGSIVRAPNGLIAQEVLLSEIAVKKLIQLSEVEIFQFQLLTEIANQCLAVGNIDSQPQLLRTWISDFLMGRLRSPGKKLATWSKASRDSLIYALVRLLEVHGIKPTRSYSGAPLSGCDAVAEAVRQIGMNNPRDFETVRKIYARQKRLSPR